MGRDGTPGARALCGPAFGDLSFGAARP
jgi:hypothetical protein